MGEPVTAVDVESRIAECQSHLEQLIGEHETAAERLADAETSYGIAYHSAHLRAYVEDPKIRGAVHESQARVDTKDEYAELQHAQQAEKVIRHAMHSWRQILSAYQSLGRFVADEAGHGRYGRRT